MIPDSDMGALVVLLYLLAYSAAAAGILLPIFAGRSARDARSRAAGRFLQALALTGIGPSLQIILDALGITEGLPGAWPATVTVLFNVLIIACLWTVAVAWAETARAFSPAPYFPDRIRKPAYIVMAALGILNIPIQAVATVRRGAAVVLTAEISLIAFIVVLVLAVITAAGRLYRRKTGVGKNAVARLLKGILPAFIVFYVVSELLPYPAGQAMPPLGLLLLFVMGILIYVRQSAASEDPGTARETLFDDAGLTPREREIALMLAEGLSYKDISEKSYVSLSTIQTHVTRIYGKMGVKSKTELSRKIGG